jgi:hypothetical protein
VELPPAPAPLGWAEVAALPAVPAPLGDVMLLPDPVPVPLPVVPPEDVPAAAVGAGAVACVVAGRFAQPTMATAQMSASIAT